MIEETDRESKDEKARLSSRTMAPGEEQIAHRLLHNVFGAVPSPGNAARQCADIPRDLLVAQSLNQQLSHLPP